MSTVKIITNSSSDISTEYAEELGIIVIADSVIKNGNVYRCGIDVRPEQFYSDFCSLDNMPTTAHPNLDAFLTAYRTAAETSDEMIFVGITSKMSGACSTSEIAKQIMLEENPQLKIHTYDSLQVSFGLALMVKEAKQKADEGCTGEEILAHLDHIRDHIGVYFLMPTLQYAKKGGRTGAIKATLADMLKIKPVLMFRDGLVKDVSVARRAEVAYERILKYYRHGAQYGGTVYIFHSNNKADAEMMESKILEMDPEAKIRIDWLGPVIGNYTGPNCVGIAFKEKYD